METNRIKKTIAIILAILFLVSLTASAVSAMKINSQLEAQEVIIKPTKSMQTCAPAFESATVGIGIVGFGKGKYPA